MDYLPTNIGRGRIVRRLNDLSVPVGPGLLQSGASPYASLANERSNYVEVRIANNTGNPRDQFQVVGLDDFLTAPGTTAPKDQFKPILKVVTPTAATHKGRFGILTGYVIKDGLGWAVTCGDTWVKVNVVSETDQYADVTDGDCTQLTSGSTGSAQILLKESGTGTKWAYVRLGNPAGAELPVPQYQWMVLQAVAQNVVGADWVMASPLT